MNAITDYERFVQQTHAAMTGIVKSPEFRASDWNDPKHRFGNVLEMIQTGKTDKEIRQKWPEIDGELLEVFHKIVDGTTCEMEKEESEEHRKKLQEKRRRENAAYRGKHGKGRGVR